MWETAAGGKLTCLREGTDCPSELERNVSPSCVSSPHRSRDSEAELSVADAAARLSVHPGVLLVRGRWCEAAGGAPYKHKKLHILAPAPTIQPSHNPLPNAAVVKLMKCGGTGAFLPERRCFPTGAAAFTGQSVRILRTSSRGGTTTARTCSAELPLKYTFLL